MYAICPAHTIIIIVHSPIHISLSLYYSTSLFLTLSLSWLFFFNPLLPHPRSPGQIMPYIICVYNINIYIYVACTCSVSGIKVIIRN